MNSKVLLISLIVMNFVTTISCIRRHPPRDYEEVKQLSITENQEDIDKSNVIEEVDPNEGFKRNRGSNKN